MRLPRICGERKKCLLDDRSKRVAIAAAARGAGAAFAVARAAAARARGGGARGQAVPVRGPTLAAGVRAAPPRAHDRRRAGRVRVLARQTYRTRARSRRRCCGSRRTTSRSSRSACSRARAARAAARRAPRPCPTSSRTSPRCARARACRRSSSAASASCSTRCAAGRGRRPVAVRTVSVCRPTSNVLEGVYYDYTPDGARPR